MSVLWPGRASQDSVQSHLDARSLKLGTSGICFFLLAVFCPAHASDPEASQPCSVRSRLGQQAAGKLGTRQVSQKALSRGVGVVSLDCGC